MQKAASEGYGIIARMPLQFGLLTGKFSTHTRFDEGDHRQFRLTPEILKKLIPMLDEKLWPLAHTEGISKTELALNFILSHREVSTVITGIRTPEQVIQNTVQVKKLSDIHLRYLQSLGQQEWKKIVELMEKQG